MVFTRLHATSFDHMTASKLADLGLWLGQPNGGTGGFTTGLEGVGKAVVPGSATLQYIYPATPFDTTRVFCRLKLTARTAARTILTLLDVTSSQIELRYLADGTLTVRRGDLGQTWTSTGPKIEVGPVYSVEFITQTHNTAGSFTVLINGTVDGSLTVTGVDTQSTVNAYVNRVSLANPEAIFDDFILDTATGGWAPNDAISTSAGNPKMATLRTVGQGSFTQWTPNAGTSDHWTYLDELDQDDATTYLHEITQNERDSWRFEPLPSTAVSVSSVATVYRISSANGALTGRHFIRFGTTNYDAAAILATWSILWEFDEQYWLVNPATGVAWLPSEVNAAQAGAKRESATSGLGVSVSQAVLVVVYNIADAPNDDGGQILTSEDVFSQGLPYGTAANMYIRVQPNSAAEAATGYALDSQWGTLHDGYLHDPTAPPGGGAAFYKFPGAGGAADALCCAVQRHLTTVVNAEITLVPRLIRPFGGVDGASSTHWVCCLARVQAGNFVTPGGSDFSEEYLRDVSCYMYLHANNAGLGHKLFVLRFINGAVTMLAQANLPPQTGIPGRRKPSKMRMKVTGTITPQIECWFQVKRVVSGGGTEIVDIQVFNVIDGSPGVLTGAGRWGYGAQSSRIEGTLTTTVVFDKFELFDYNANAVRFRDLFLRPLRRTAKEFQEVIPITEARSLMCDWTGDLHGMNAPSTTDTLDHYAQLVGNTSRVEVGQTFAIGTAQKYGWYFRQRPAVNENQRRSVDVTPTSNDTAITRDMGIVLRASLNYPEGETIELQGDKYRKRGGYLALIHYESGPDWLLRFYHIDPTLTGGNAQPTLLAEIDVASFGLVLGSTFTLDFEVLNFAEGGLPGMRVRLNGALVTVALTDLLVEGTTLIAGWLVDLRSNASTAGLGEGFYFYPSATAATELAYFDNWLEGARSTPPPLGDDDQESVVLDSEQEGVTGELVTRLSWPVRETKRHDNYRYDFEIPRPAVRRRYLKTRRHFVVGVRGLTTADRQAFLTFVDDHRGTEIPFHWIPPLETSSIVAHFPNTKFRTALVGSPNVESFDFEIEELVDY